MVDLQGFVIEPYGTKYVDWVGGTVCSKCNTPHTSKMIQTIESHVCESVIQCLKCNSYLYFAYGFIECCVDGKFYSVSSRNGEVIYGEQVY